MRFIPTLLALLALFGGPSIAASAKPNLVVIYADDLGYGDDCRNGAIDVSTAAIDRLAREGLRFTSGCSLPCACKPTPASPLTGTYPFRQEGAGIAPPNGPAIIQPNTEPLPAILKRAGHAFTAARPNIHSRPN